MKDYEPNNFRTLLYIVITDIKKLYDKIVKDGFEVITELELREQADRQLFRCTDPDGNLVEVLEKR